MTAFDVEDDTLSTMNGKYKNNISGIIQKPISPDKLARMIMAKIKN
jgi:predicted metal-binding protein